MLNNRKLMTGTQDSACGPDLPIASQSEYMLQANKSLLFVISSCQTLVTFASTINYSKHDVIHKPEVHGSVF